MTTTSQHRTLADYKAHREAVKYNHDIQTVSWGYRDVYSRANVTYLIGFVCWLARNEEFYVIVNRREFKVKVFSDGWAFFAVTDNYDGPEDHINLNVDGSGESALEGLIEKLQMAIEEGRI